MVNDGSRKVTENFTEKSVQNADEGKHAEGRRMAGIWDKMAFIGCPCLSFGLPALDRKLEGISVGRSSLMG